MLWYPNVHTNNETDRREPSTDRSILVRADGHALTGEGVTVAVIDSGWDRTLRNSSVLPGVGLVDPMNDFAFTRTDDDHDRVGHGTGCTHLVLQIAPAASIIPIRVFGTQLQTSPEILVAALDWAVERRVGVVNLSLGTIRPDARDALYAACARAAAAGIIVVAAVGRDAAGYPSAFDVVISVGGGARWDDPFVYSYTPDDMIECRSPGRRRPTIGLGGKPRVASGTSFAAPNISGIIALWLQRWPNLQLAGVREKLAEFSSDMPDRISAP